jgi:hypothetical protein
MKNLCWDDEIMHQKVRPGSAMAVPTELALSQPQTHTYNASNQGMSGLNTNFSGIPVEITILQ